MTARDRLLDAAVKLVREQGYAGTSVDTLCAAAGVTKGAFFHHFASKEALGIAAAAHWGAHAAALFDHAAYRTDPDPVARVLAYVDHRATLIDGTPAEFCCLAGTLVQEVHESHPSIRDACRDSIFGHADSLADDFEAAIAARGVVGVTGIGLARHVQAVLQGGFIMAKAMRDPAPALEAVAHLRRYLVMILGEGERK
jgi:TetR/AcrR family transcriptional repressor of nem operon